MPVAVLVVKMVPALWLGYPLVLLPLLLTGPLAVSGLAGARAVRAAVLAGGLAAIVAAGSLAVGSQLLGQSAWGLVAAASSRPMPPLPQVSLLPSAVMTWPQQDVLVFQPLLAVASGLLVQLAGALGRRIGRPLASLLVPRSLSARLGVAFAGLTVITFLLGFVSFAMLEEMHGQVHRLQLQVEWQRHLSEAQAALDAPPAAGSSKTIDTIYAELASAEPYPGVYVGRSTLSAIRDRYLPFLEAAAASYRASREQPGDARAAAAARADLILLRQAVDADAEALLQASDLDHHVRLMLVMAAVGGAGALSLWMGGEILARTREPLQALRRHLLRVARGDFGGRVAVSDPEELAQLGSAVNRMTGELDRLYTTERAARARAEAAAERERRLAAAKEFWTNTVVHDLKGPLSIVSGLAELLHVGRFGHLSEEQRAALGELQGATTSLLDLVADINEAFRLEAADLPLHTQAVQPAELLAAVARAHRRPGTRPTEVDCPPHVPAVLADPRLLRRILDNLVDNAHKHAGAAARVVLSVGAAGDAIQFAVEDDGRGIPAHLRERVFEPFVQGDTARPGSGLGLAFCRRAVEQHGGRIWIEDAPSGGSRVCFSLPVALAGSRDEDQRHGLDRAGPGSLVA